MRILRSFPASNIKSGSIGINITHSQDTARCRFPKINRAIVTSGAIAMARHPRPCYDYFGLRKRLCRVQSCFEAGNSFPAGINVTTRYYFLSSLLCKSRNCFSTFSAIGKSPKVVYPSFAIRKYFIASRLFLIAE